MTTESQPTDYQRQHVAFLVHRLELSNDAFDRVRRQIANKAICFYTRKDYANLVTELQRQLNAKREQAIRNREAEVH